MATFNWSTNPYFTTNRYKSPHGSDLTGDGTINNPYRTIQKCIDSGGTNIQCAPEVIRETWTGSPSLYLENGCIIDQFLGGTISNNIFNVKIINGRFGNTTNTRQNDVFFKGALTAATNKQITGQRNLILLNTGSKIYNYYGCNGGQVFNSTFINVLINLNVNNPIIVYPNGFNRCIFSGCDILIAFDFSHSSDAYDFNLFHNCRYRFGNDVSYLTQSQIEATYGVIGIDAVKAYYNAKFGTNNVFNYSRVADPLFNNPAYDDYTLQPNSPARHMAYDGTYIGAKDVAFPTFAFANDLGQPNSFYNASANANLIVQNNRIALVRNPDGTAVGDGIITEKPKDLGIIYELKSNQLSSTFADRNREMIDENADIDLSSPISAGTALTQGVIYINEGGSVVYNGVTYPNRSRITAINNSLSFTTTEGAVLYAITIYPNRYTNLIRHKQTISGTQIAAGTDVLTVNSWYRVFNNSITWDGKIIPVGDSFQAVTGKLSFTGTGVCVEEFNDSDVWSEIIVDAPIKCRRVGNVITGAIDIGTDGKPLTNGHPEYYNATNRPRAEFSIFARYTQKKWKLNTKMSK